MATRLVKTSEQAKTNHPRKSFGKRVKWRKIIDSFRLIALQ